MDKRGVWKFVEEGTKAVEAETGMSINESINKAIQVAISAAVIDTIKEGARKGHWSFKEEGKNDGKPIAAVVPLATETKPTEQPTAENTQPNVPIPKKQTPQGIITEWSNIRTGKDLSSNKVANVKPNTVAEILNSEGEYYLVRVDGKEGWINKKYIKVQQQK